MNSWMKRGLGLMLVLGVTALAACGGGGGGNGGGLSYTGSQSPAAVSAANAEAISLGAYEGAELGASTDFVSDIQPAAATLQVAVDLIEGGAGQGRLFKPGSAQIGAMQSRMMSGPCGGQATLTGDAGQDGTFSGSLSFQDFCSENMMLRGSMSFSGIIDSGTQAMEFSMNFDSLAMSTEGRQVVLDGSTLWSIAGSGDASVTMNMMLFDELEQKTCKTEDMVVTLSGGAGYVDSTLSGRYYDPDHGYVDIATELAVRTELLAAAPSQGILRFTGAGGSAARLSFHADGSYGVEVDPAGTGNFVPLP